MTVQFYTKYIDHIKQNRKASL